MDNALRVYDHFDLRRFRMEQKTGLDHFQALVHQRRRVNRNLAPHYPFWVSARLLWRNGVEHFARRAQKRPARCGEPQALDAGMREIAIEIARQCLKNRIVLTVDW